MKGTNTRTEKDGRVHGLKRAREEEEGDTGMEREKEKNHKRAEGRVAGQSAGAPTTRGVWRIREAQQTASGDDGGPRPGGKTAEPGGKEDSSGEKRSSVEKGVLSGRKGRVNTRGDIIIIMGCSEAFRSFIRSKKNNRQLQNYHISLQFLEQD